MVSGCLELSELDIAAGIALGREERKKNPPWFARVQGNLVKIYREGCEPPPHVKEKRKPIGPWSHQSRMNLLRKLNVFDYALVGPSVFVTLTYPDEVDKMPYKNRSLHRGAFAQILERWFGRSIPVVWRIEWEERKSGRYTGRIAPHFHLMVFTVPELARGLVRKWWRRALKRGPGPLIVHSKPIYNQDGALRYLSKYVSKYKPLDITAYHNSGIEFGRHWGILREELIPRSPVLVDRRLTDDEVFLCKKYAASRWKDYDVENGGGYTLLGPGPVETYKKLLF